MLVCITAFCTVTLVGFMMVKLIVISAFIVVVDGKKALKLGAVGFGVGVAVGGAVDDGDWLGGPPAGVCVGEAVCPGDVLGLVVTEGIGVGVVVEV